MRKQWMRLPIVLSSLIVVGVLFADNPLAARTWTLEAQGGVASSWWFTSDDDDDEEHVGHAIDYKVQESRHLSAVGMLRHHDRELCALWVNVPFDSNRIEGAIIDRGLFDVAGLIGPDPGIVLQLVSGLRLEYRRSRLWGSGRAVVDAVLIDSHGRQAALPVGEEFEFDVDFEDWYASLFGVRSEDYRISLGWYHSELNKPHEAFDPADHVIESRLVGQGVFLQGATSSFDGMIRGGTVEFEPQGGPVQGVFQGKGSVSFLAEFNLSPALTLMGPARGTTSRLPRLALMPVVGAMFRADYVNPANGEPGSAEGELSMDILARIEIRLIGRF